LDLDETLIHADFFEEFPEKSENKYDKIISFYTEEPTNFSIENTDNTTTDDESKDDSSEKVLNKVGIFLRPKVQEFLKEISNYFIIGIFTASIPEYADAVINYLDPDEKLVKFRLYRNDCVNLENLVKIKDLRIFGENNLNRIVLLDNNIYSFSAQLSNGILINSFFGDKNDDELSNVRKYLIEYISPSDDVRKINEQFFGFETLFNEFSKLHF
jgi:CTD small phosphatase-like protein 2